MLDTTWKLVALTKGYYAIVDSGDYEAVMQHSWIANVQHRNGHSHVYAVRRTMHHGVSTTIYMHEAILGKLPGYQIDHKNGLGTDNRRSNIRHCTQSQNHQNQTKAAGRSSRYKGVHWDKRNNMWVSRLRCAGKEIWLGRYASEDSAGHAYNQAAIKHFGEFALLNDVCQNATA